MAKDIETCVREAQQQFPAFRNKLVLMLDMTVYPPEVRVLPVHKLEQFPGNDPIWLKFADEIHARSDSPPKGYMFSVVKVHSGNAKFMLFSLSTALSMAFEGQYFQMMRRMILQMKMPMIRKHQDDSELLNDTDGSEDKCYEV
jgi:hypothetical protein